MIFSFSCLDLTEKSVGHYRAKMQFWTWRLQGKEGVHPGKLLFVQQFIDLHKTKNCIQWINDFWLYAELGVIHLKLVYIKTYCWSTVA